MNTIEKLRSYFRRFPHIGSRQAERLAYFILREGPAFAEEFGKALLSVRDTVGACEQCGRFFPRSEPTKKEPLCTICANPATLHTLLMVVEKDADLDTIRESGAFAGRYFVLGGTIPLAGSREAAGVRLKALHAEVRRALADDNLTEVIIALSATAEGDHTAARITEILHPLRAVREFRISILGRGLSAGAELEYADPGTLAHALKNRS